MIIGIDATRATEEQKTGVGWYAFFLIQELKKIIPKEVTVILYTNKPLQGVLKELPENWEEKILSWPPKRLWTQIRLSFEMLFHAPDILFIPAHVFPLIHPKKTIMTVHDIAAKRFPHSYSLFERLYSLWSAKFAGKYLWKVITPSHFTKKELQEVFHFGKKESDKIFVVHLGYDEAYNREKKTSDVDVLKKYGIVKSYFLSLGRLEEKKNTKESIRAFALWRKRNKKDFQYVCVGGIGFGYDEIQKEKKKNEFSEDILELGWIPPHDLKIIVRYAKVFLFPSLYEGFGIPALEAMASGVPVIATRGQSVEEIGGDALWYAKSTKAEDIAETLQEMSRFEEKRNEKIQKGLERVKQFSWEKMAEETWNILYTEK
ncbi:MAG: glycosyltransferase family 1 protein [Candidatus Magasanikbacteria bacterium]